jgi:hypothetical protein
VLGTRVWRDYVVDLSIDSPNGPQLRVVVYNGNRERVKTSPYSSSWVDLSWTAHTPIHYLRVDPLTLMHADQTAEYRLEIYAIAPAPTPTPTPTLPPPFSEDEYEPNDSFSAASILPTATSIALDDVTFYPQSDEDWFLVYVKAGQCWECRTSDLLHVDTYLQIYDQDQVLAAADDDGGEGLASEVGWQGSYDGYYAVRVSNLAGSVGAYDLSCSLTLGTVMIGTNAEYAPFEYVD